jgi:hypothetical protein
MNEEKNKNLFWYGIMAGALIVVAVIAILSIKNYSVSADTTAGNVALNTGVNTDADTNSNDVQTARVYIDSNYNYQMEPKVLKKGIPVQLTVDLNTVNGCARDFTIPSLGVRKYVKEGDNVITFTPTKAGTITMACSMNMYRGTFQVSDETGNVPKTDDSLNYAAASTTIVPNGGATCGAGKTGGCGCGMHAVQ